MPLKRLCCVRILIYLLLLTPLLFGEVYYSKVEPYKFKNISSNVVGQVLSVDEEMIGKKLSNKPFITVDAELDTAELKDIKEKITSLKDTLKIDKIILKNISEVLVKKRKNFKKTEALKIKSRIDKDREFYDLIVSENLYNSTQKEINNLKNSIADLNFRMAQLKKSIKDKKIIENGYVLYSIDVKEGQTVNQGTALASVADISKAILTVYVDGDTLKSIDKKVIYLDDKKTNYKISRLLNIADSINISKYKIQIIIKSPKLFSKLVKIEFKDTNNEK